jgi:AhpD family alkylhydroperoxidase
MSARLVTAIAVLLATLSAQATGSGEAPAPTTPPVPVATLLEQARARVNSQPRVPLADSLPVDAALLLGASTTPNYVRALGQIPQAAPPMAALVSTFLYKGAVPSELKAAIGLRIAQVNNSPYVAAHVSRVLKASPDGERLATALASGNLESLRPYEQVALRHTEALTRNVNGVSPEAFASTRGAFNDSEIVELTMTTAFFNYLTRYAEALRLPVEPWALDSPAPAPTARSRMGTARVALISDEEIAATSAAAAAAKEQASQPNGWGIGMANSQRAMLRVPALAHAWRDYGKAVRTDEQVGRDIKLQVSFAVSMANGCRYCTLHQVLGLRRLGVEPAKLVAMQKDDSALTPREKVAVVFARKLTREPGATTDADYAALVTEFGSRGGLEVLLQTCGFAFMNRFTDGLQLPSEDEAVRVYQETYGRGWQKTN